VQNRAKYDPKVPMWLNAYILVHFLLTFYMAVEDGPAIIGVMIAFSW